jgi:hypothetical protein
MDWLPSGPTVGEHECEIPDHDKKDLKHLDIDELEEHGGLWFADPYEVPIRRPDHTVCYTWHKWQAGAGGDNGLDIWAALEFYPDNVALLPTEDRGCCDGTS